MTIVLYDFITKQDTTFIDYSKFNANNFSLN
jgi:hypothetical protein